MHLLRRAARPRPLRLRSWAPAAPAPAFPPLHRPATTSSSSSSSVATVVGVHRQTGLVAAVPETNTPLAAGTIVALGAEGRPGVLLWQRSLLYMFALLDDLPAVLDAFLVVGSPVHLPVGATAPVSLGSSSTTDAPVAAASPPRRLAAHGADELIGRDHVGIASWMTPWSTPGVPYGRNVDVFEAAANHDERSVITRPMITGIAAVDTLTPVGCGQSMLVVGTAGAGEHAASDHVATTPASSATSSPVSSLASIDAAGLAWRHAFLPQVAAFAATDSDQKRATTVVHALLSPANDTSSASSPSSPSSAPPSRGAAHTAVLRLSPGASATHSLLCAMSAFAVAESHASAGHDVLVILDDITPIRRVWAASTQLLLDHYGDDGHHDSGPGELRTFYSALTERAACKMMRKAGESGESAVWVGEDEGGEDEEEGGGGEERGEEKGGSVTCILGMPSEPVGTGGARGLGDADSAVDEHVYSAEVRVHLCRVSYLLV